MKTIKFKTEREKFIWLAAFIDGEGSLMLVKRNREGSRKGYRYNPELTIISTTRNFLKCAKEVCEEMGNLNYSDEDRDLLRYQLGSSGLRKILPKILPFLIVKRKQAKLLIEALDILNDNMKHSGAAIKNEEHKEKFDENYRRLDKIHKKIFNLQNYNREK